MPFPFFSASPYRSGSRELSALSHSFLTLGARGAGSRPREPELRKLFAPEIGPGDAQIATPRIRPHGARNDHTSHPFRGACSEIAEVLKIWRNSGKILEGGLWNLGMLFVTREIETLKLFAPEIGPGDVPIATPRIRQPRGPETRY